MSRFSSRDAAPEPCLQCGAPATPMEWHWIEIELVDEDSGEPVPYEEYCVTIPGGARIRGWLDENGRAHVGGIEEPGDCEITFPRLDRQTWKQG